MAIEDRINIFIKFHPPKIRVLHPIELDLENILIRHPKTEQSKVEGFYASCKEADHIASLNKKVKNKRFIHLMIKLET